MTSLDRISLKDKLESVFNKYKGREYRGNRIFFCRDDSRNVLRCRIDRLDKKYFQLFTKAEISDFMIERIKKEFPDIENFTFIFSNKVLDNDFMLKIEI